MKSLLMGGQACVLYGAAEFSRDADFALLADADNLARLRRALDDLRADCIAVPPFERAYLDMGLAVHFRSKHPDAMNVWIDVMSKMRGVEDFPALWDRRTTFHSGDVTLEALSLPDLVQAKKTQRDRDWPMIVRLVEANFFVNSEQPDAEHVRFWLKELRTPSLLVEVAGKYPDECERLKSERGLLALAQARDEAALAAALHEETEREREADREYWKPLKQELERLRRTARKR